MNGPQFTRFFWPIIEALRQLGGSGSPSEVRDRVFENLKVSETEQSETISSGSSRIYNQIQWARLYLVRSGYMDGSSPRGVWSLTEQGSKANKFTPEQIIGIFKKVQGEIKDSPVEKDDIKGTDGASVFSQEQVVLKYREDIRNVLMSLPASGFEKLCQRLLRESGFERVSITGKSGDGGIDGNGVILVNPFVSFNVVFQCKRYSGSVVPSQVREFRGAMDGRTDKGIIITTGSFTKESSKEAFRDGVKPIELVDGERLIDMFVELELGIKKVQTYEIDATFFKDFQS